MYINYRKDSGHCGQTTPSKAENVDKKRAAILTWCDNNGPTNYGQILQCYAMQRLVDSWGYDSFVVQYRTKDERDIMRHNFSNRNPIGRWLNTYYENKYNLEVIEYGETPRVQAFKNFIKQHIRLTAPCYTKEAVEYETRDCELLVCGSDQIWNPLWFHPIWFLGFGTKEQKRIAYAPSGIFYEDEESVACYKKMAPLVERLDIVTVREQLGADILSKYTDKETHTVLDPTLLMDCVQWNEVAAERLMDEDYIFCYVMGSIRPHQLILRELLKKHGAKKVVYIPSNLLQEGQLPDFVKWEDAGPAEFISLIKHAKAVCTDSFHGTAISVLYEKQFYNVKRVQAGVEKFGGSERVNNLMEQLKISSRTLGNVKEAQKIREIDYKKVSEELQRLREAQYKKMFQLECQTSVKAR